MCADERFSASVVEVTLHEEVEEMSSVTTDGAEFGVTAFQDLVTEGRTHVCTTLKKRAGKLQRNSSI